MRRSTIMLTCTTLFSLTPAVGLDAQPPEDVVGEVVRVRGAGQAMGPGGLHVSNAVRTGTLLDIRGDTLLLDQADGHGIARLVLHGASTVERRGAVSAVGVGRFYGALTGMVVGGGIALARFEQERAPVCRSIGEALATALGSHSCPVRNRNHRGREALNGGVLGALVGGVLGWAVTRGREVDGWIPVEAGQIRMAVATARVGVGWGPTVRVTF